MQMMEIVMMIRRRRRRRLRKSWSKSMMNFFNRPGELSILTQMIHSPNINICFW